MQNEKAVLSLLADGRFHSGEELGSLLGVTRSAVWKKIKSLEQRYGIPVQAVRGKGYSVSDQFELLSVPDIEHYMTAEALALKSHIDIKQTIYSTHDFLLNEQKTGLPSGTVCLAEHQSQGRGRRGRTWVSPYGSNIYCSLLWRFELAPTQLVGLSLALSTAVTRALQQFGISHGLSLKWPNDIYWNGRKLGGLLIDIIGEANGVCTVVASVGLNVRLPSHAVQEIDQPCVDVSRIIGQLPSRNQLSGLLLNELLLAFPKFTQAGFKTFKPDWDVLDIAKNKSVTLSSDTRTISGTAKGVNEAGQLMLEIDGAIQHFQSGDISLRVHT